MCHEDQCGPMFVAQIEQQIDNGGTIVFIKVPGGFIGQEYTGAGRRGACQRNTLLLAS